MIWLLRWRLYESGNNLIDLVVRRHLEQCFIGRALLNILESIRCLTKARVILRALYNEL
jgi:hypothetical protein